MTFLGIKISKENMPDRAAGKTWIKRVLNIFPKIKKFMGGCLVLV